MTKKLIEVVHGKRSKYEIYRNETALGFDFSIHKDGTLWKSGFKDLRNAVEKAKEDK
jgi:hypothetical protein